MPSPKLTEDEQVQQFLTKKTLHGPKTDPVWVFLEREMQEKAASGEKPYNQKVGDWLQYLKELKYYFYVDAQKKLKVLKKNVGPIWFMQLSGNQTRTLNGLRANIHKDLIEELPHRTQSALKNLGIVPKISDRLVMQAMMDCNEDPGLFIWNLYTAVYGTEPSHLKKEYNMNGMILMSALVSIDFDECISELEKLTYKEKPKLPPPKPVKPPPKVPSGKMGAYLQEFVVPPIGKDRPYGKPRDTQPAPLGYKFKMKSDAVLTKTRMDKKFLNKRMQRNKPKKQEGKVTNYKFWTPPPGFRTLGESADIVAATNMLRKRPRANHLTSYDNLQFHIGGVTFCCGRPYYIINSAIITPTGYIPVHGGLVMTAEGYTIPVINGLYKPAESKDVCEDACDCLKWHDRVMSYLEHTKCKCGHLYDFLNEGKTKERYFHPPTKHTPFHFDEAKIYQMDPTDDFIRDTVDEALRSETEETVTSQPSILPSGMKIEELLNTFLSDLADTPLIIPHLPNAGNLPGLHEWCRKRLKGALSEKSDKRNKIYSARKWLELNHVDFRARAYRIPFTQEELHNMNWSHRKMIQKLFNKMLNDFIYRNRIKQLEHARLFWPTMMNEKYPNEAFLKTYYTYMPGRLMDTYMLNPYSSILTKKYGAKTCPLR